MKPLLERKRRARINKCLDELKDIMTAALQSQGENVSKLEKADILELTVRHLHKMQQARRLMTTSRNPLEEIHRYLFFFDKFVTNLVFFDQNQFFSQLFHGFWFYQIRWKIDTSKNARKGKLGCICILSY